MSMHPALVALGVTIAAAALEGLAAGGGVRQRLGEVRQPAGSPPFALWIAIGALYYVTCFVVCLRLLSADPAVARKAAFCLLIALLLGNVAWNAVFFRLRSLHLSWWVSLGYWGIAVGLTVALWSADRVALWAFVPYLAYLFYGTWWVYRVWRLNQPGHTA